MIARSVTAAADVIARAMANGKQTPAGWAMALDAMCMLQTPETAAELEQLRARVAELEVDLTAKAQDAEAAVQGWGRSRERVAELEASPLAWADRLDAKSLDNFLICLATATEHEPMSGAVDEIHQLIRSFREHVGSVTSAEESADKLTRLLAPMQTLRDDEPAAEQPLTVFRASHDSIVMGLYTSREAAREHCKKLMELENSALTLDWRPDGPWREGGDSEPGPYEAEELYEYGTHEASTWNPTGYVVTPLEVASEYDAEADE